jgi:hypothetical protein
VRRIDGAPTQPNAMRAAPGPEVGARAREEYLHLRRNL